jgi:hypothetical protein
LKRCSAALQKILHLQGDPQKTLVRPSEWSSSVWWLWDWVPELLLSTVRKKLMVPEAAVVQLVTCFPSFQRTSPLRPHTHIKNSWLYIPASVLHQVRKGLYCSKDKGRILSPWAQRRTDKDCPSQDNYTRSQLRLRLPSLSEQASCSSSVKTPIFGLITLNPSPIPSLCLWRCLTALACTQQQHLRPVSNCSTSWGLSPPDPTRSLL